MILYFVLQKNRLEDAKIDAEEDNQPQTLQLIQSLMAKIEAEVASEYRQFKRSTAPVPLEELHRLREKWRKVVAVVFFEMGKEHFGGLGGTTDAPLPAYWGIPPTTSSTSTTTTTSQDKKEGEEKDTNNKKKKKKIRQCATCSKEQAEGWKLKKCARCQTTYYCGAACQRKHWPTHKQTCIAKTQ